MKQKQIFRLHCIINCEKEDEVISNKKKIIDCGAVARIVRFSMDFSRQTSYLICNMYCLCLWHNNYTILLLLVR